MNAVFGTFVRAVDPQFLTFEKLKALQLNLGNRCNQTCAHCHVSAGPNGTKTMSKQVTLKIVEFLKHSPGLCVDITGGCPELNPNFRSLLDSVRQYASRLMVRTNLTILLEDGFKWVPKLYSENRACLIASLPCYTRGNVDTQRGKGVFDRSLVALRLLNALGYGSEEGLELNLVYNPGGGFLPGAQQQLEAAYRAELAQRFGISFNRLFSIANAPIGRFRRQMESEGLLKRYMQLLVDNFNPDAAEHIMCRSLVSVAHNGVLYNCDFNQALSEPIRRADGEPATIDQLEDLLAGQIAIVTGDHCFCCTAGSGSSCTGSLVRQ